MANLDFDPASVDPMTAALTRSRPIPDIAHGSISGINGVVSPGLWNGGDGAANWPEAGPVPLPRSRPAQANQTDDALPEIPAVKGDRQPQAATFAQRFEPVGRAEASSSDAPGRPLATRPEENAAPPPTMQPSQGSMTPSSGFHLFPEGSMLDRLMTNLGNFRDQNRLTLLAMAGGLAGSQSWGQGLGRAFTAAVPAQRADLAFNEQNATIRALQARGFPPDMAMAIATNPATLQSVLQQMTGTAPAQHIVVKDSLGNEIPLVFDPVRRQYTLPNGQPYGAPGGGAGGGANLPGVAGVAQMQPEIDPQTGRDEKFLAALKQSDPTAWSVVTDLLSGNASAAGRNMQKYLPYATRAEPGFDMKTYQQRLTAQKYWYSGGEGDKILKRLDQGTEHAGALAGSVDKLGNWQFPAANALGNFASAQMGNPASGPLALNAHALADEFGGIWKGANLSDTEIKAWADGFPVNGSIDQQKASVRKFVELVEGGIGAIERQRQRDLGPAAATLPGIPQSALQNIERLKRWAETPNAKWGGEQQQAAPQQQQQQLPRMASPADAMKLPPGTHFLDANGVERIRP